MATSNREWSDEDCNDEPDPIASLYDQLAEKELIDICLTGDSLHVIDNDNV